MSEKYGKDCKFYHGSAGSTATNELTIVREATLNMEKGESDITSRANAGWKATGKGLKDAGVDFEILYDPDDAGFQAIRDAYLNDTAIALCIRDSAGGQGLDADVVITSFSRTEPLEEAMIASFTAKITYVSRAPSWVTS